MKSIGNGWKRAQEASKVNQILEARRRTDQQRKEWYEIQMQGMRNSVPELRDTTEHEQRHTSQGKPGRIPSLAWWKFW